MTNTENILKIDRQKKILDIVSTKKSVPLSELEKLLRASRITIQRDLVELEKRDLLKRYHGGASSIEYSDSVYDIKFRKTINVDIKKSIVKKAAALIKPGQYICMDASSTVYYISKEILLRDIFVLTPGMETFSNLAADDSCEAVLSGGRLNKKTNSLTGPEAVATIKKFQFDLAFISAEAYVPGKGFFDPYEDEVDVKKAIIESSTKTAVLIDSLKVRDTGGVKICSSQDIAYLITDDHSNRLFKQDFKGRML